MPTHQPDILTDKKERSDFFIALFVILIAGIFITKTSIRSLFTSDTEIEAQKKIASAAIVDTEDLSTEIKDISELTHAEELDIKADDILHTNTSSVTLSENGRSPSSSIIQTDTDMDYAKEIPVAIDVIGEVSTEITSELKTEIPIVTEEIKEDLSDLKDDVVEIAEEVISSEDDRPSIIEAPQSEEKRKNVLTSAIQESDKKDCIIAVGLYRDQNNIKTLMTRLELEGYDAFSKRIRSMTQVGVYISCDPVVSKSVLSEIREIYAKDAFIVE